MNTIKIEEFINAVFICYNGRFNDIPAKLVIDWIDNSDAFGRHIAPNWIVIYPATITKHFHDIYGMCFYTIIHELMHVDQFKSWGKEDFDGTEESVYYYSAKYCLDNIAEIQDKFGFTISSETIKFWGNIVNLYEKYKYSYSKTNVSTYIFSSLLRFSGSVGESILKDCYENAASGNIECNLVMEYNGNMCIPILHSRPYQVIKFIDILSSFSIKTTDTSYTYTMEVADLGDAIKVVINDEP